MAPQFQQCILRVLEVLRNFNGTYSWVEFQYALGVAQQHAVNTGLSAEQKVLERTMWRGQFVMRKCNDPKLTLALFTDKLPNAKGVTRAQLSRDVKDLRVLAKASRPPGAAAAVPAAPVPGAAGPGAYGFSPPLAFGFGAGGIAAPPAASSLGLSATPAVGFPAPVTLPLPGGATSASGASKKGKGSAGGGGGGGGSKPPSNRDLTAIATFNGALQAAQQQHHPVAGGPTCNKCTAAGRNPHHNHLSCAFMTCSKCKRVGHRANACPFG